MFRAASPFSSPGSHTRKRVVAKPSLTAYLAITNPSQPLFPLPQQIASLFFPLRYSFLIRRYVLLPAFSMSTAEGIPQVLIAYSSYLFILSGERIFTGNLRG